MDDTPTSFRKSPSVNSSVLMNILAPIVDPETGDRFSDSQEYLELQNKLRELRNK